MIWSKAGRPKTVKAQLQDIITDIKPALEIEDSYTAEELHVFKDRLDGMRGLALAIIKQWVKDGQPEKDAQKIIGWYNIYKNLEK